MNTKLWQPIQVGNIKLNHCLAMAPGESVVENFTRLLLDGLRHGAP